MRVALVHDDLVQWGGAERVLLAISEVFPDAPIFTSVFDKNNLILKDFFGGKKIRTSFLQAFPGWRTFYKGLLPLYPLAFEQFDFSDFDLVISQTTRFAKSIITKPGQRHVCYCHTPPRFLWHFSSSKINSFFEPLLSFLRLYDRITSFRVDYFLAGSKNAQTRIKKVYKRDSDILLPFVDLNKFQSVEIFDGGYYLAVSRLNDYKRLDIAVDAFNENKKRLKIVGSGPEQSNLKLKAKENIEFFDRVSEKLLINLIAGCKGLVICAEEDFGLTSLEAQALGKGVIAYGRGGALETIIPNKTGVLFNDQTPQDLNRSISEFERLMITAKSCQANAQGFSKKVFMEKFQGLIEKI